MANPSSPSNVRISVLKSVLGDLQAIQYEIDNPPYDSFQSISGDLSADLRGMMENVATVAGQKYGSSLQYVDQGWRDVKSGIAALTALLNSTIAQHSAADNQAAQNATQTNTSSSAPAAGKS